MKQSEVTYQLHVGEENLSSDNLVVKKLRTFLPKYADFLFSKVDELDEIT